MWSFLARLFGKPQTPAATGPIPIPPADPLTPRPLRVSEAALAELRRGTGPGRHNPFTGLPTPPPGVRPDKVAPGMAMDEAGNVTQGGAWGAWAMAGLWGEGLWFMGYPYLAELAQRPEYRNIAETIAEEMTRKWIKIVSTGDDDKTPKVKASEDAMKALGLREAFQRASELDGFMGIGFIYIDTGATDDPAELRTPLLLVKGKIDKGTLRGFVPVDPTWCSPMTYNSTDPLKPDYFVPSIWYVMGKQVHASRLIIIRSREVPDILKAAYNFGGLSLSQMAKPYVDNWLRTRQSVSDLLHAFTSFVLKTTLGAYLQDAKAFGERIAAFIFGRDNKGLMMVDKETEDFDNVSAPLGTLDHLQAQAQEQMASVSRIPLCKLLSITPTGLNATTDGEIRVFYDRIHAAQEKTFGPGVTVALKVIQLSEFGAIDPEIGYEFVPLWELDAAGKAAVEKMKADTDAVYMQESVISSEEVRTRLAGDPESPYHGLEGPAPEPPEPVDAGNPDLTDISESIEKRGAEGSNSEANSGA